MAGWFAAHEALIDVVLINILLGLGMYIVMTAGLISLAGAGLMAAGSYAGALASTRAEVPFPLSLALGMLAGAALAAILSVPVVRLRTHYLAIATLAFSLVISAILLNWGAVSGGAIGFITVPRSTTTTWLLGAVCVAVVALESIFRSETGRILAAIKNDEYLCQANGVYTGYYKFLALITSGILSGMAGGLYAHYLGVLQPSDFREDRAFEMLSFTVLGGAWHWSGSAIGAVVLTSIPEFLRVFAEYRDILTGLVLLLVIMVMPQGIVQPRPFRLAKRRILKRDGPRARPASADSSRTSSTKRTLLGPAPAKALSVHVDGIDKHFGGVYALRKVTINLEPGLIYGLIGPNGSGKTTLLNIANGFLRPDAGAIRFGGGDGGRLSPVRASRRGVARTFQEPRVLEEATSYANVVLGCHRLRNAGAIESCLHTSRARREDRVHDERVWAALAKVGLVEFAQTEAGELSFGQKRLVELARVLVSNAGLVILDEPTAGVNPIMIDRLAQWVRDPGAHRPTYLIAEHNIDFVMEVCDYVFVLDTGSILAEGLPHDVRVDERVIEAYLGSTA